MKFSKSLRDKEQAKALRHVFRGRLDIEYLRRRAKESVLRMFLPKAAKRRPRIRETKTIDER